MVHRPQRLLLTQLGDTPEAQIRWKCKLCGVGTTEDTSGYRLRNAIRLHKQEAHPNAKVPTWKRRTLAQTIRAKQLRSKARATSLNSAVASRLRQDMGAWTLVSWPHFRYKKGQVTRFSVSTAWVCRDCFMYYRGAKPKAHQCKKQSAHFTTCKKKTLERDRSLAITMLKDGHPSWTGSR